MENSSLRSLPFFSSLQHKRIHWTWTCEICKTTMLKSRFKKHMETEHGEKDIEVFTCKCQFETFTENDLNNHMESCTTINKVTCEFCQKKLSKFQLTKHIKNVHGDLVEESVKLEDKINDENNEPTLTFDDTDSFKQEDDLIDQGLSGRNFQLTFRSCTRIMSSRMIKNQMTN